MHFLNVVHNRGLVKTTTKGDIQVSPFFIITDHQTLKQKFYYNFPREAIVHEHILKS